MSVITGILVLLEEVIQIRLDALCIYIEYGYYLPLDSVTDSVTDLVHYMYI